MKNIMETLKVLALMVVGAILVVAVIQWQMQSQVANLRADINQFARLTCESGQSEAMIRKYNGLVNALYDDVRDRERANIDRGDEVKAAINHATARDIKRASIQLTKPDCSKLILP